MIEIALIAHDKKKHAMIQFTVAYKSILSQHQLFVTGTTGKKLWKQQG